MSFNCPNVTNNYCRLMETTCVPGKGICVLKGKIARADQLAKEDKKMRVYRPVASEIASTANWDEWHKKVSEFSWHYDQKETCYILEGEAEVMDNSGKRIRFRKGDMVEFDEGLSCVWKIHSAIRKKFRFG